MASFPVGIDVDQFLLSKEYFTVPPLVDAAFTNSCSLPLYVSGFVVGFVTTGVAWVILNFTVVSIVPSSHL